MQTRRVPSLIFAEAQYDALLVRIDPIEKSVEGDAREQQKSDQKKESSRNAATKAAAAVAITAATPAHDLSHPVLAATQNFVEVGRLLAAAATARAPRPTTPRSTAAFAATVAAAATTAAAALITPGHIKSGPRSRFELKMRLGLRLGRCRSSTPCRGRSQTQNVRNAP